MGRGTDMSTQYAARPGSRKHGSEARGEAVVAEQPRPEPMLQATTEQAAVGRTLAGRGVRVEPAEALGESDHRAARVVALVEPVGVDQPRGRVVGIDERRPQECPLLRPEEPL